MLQVSRERKKEKKRKVLNYNKIPWNSAINSSSVSISLLIEWFAVCVRRTSLTNCCGSSDKSMISIRSSALKCNFLEINTKQK